ncbi:hypothetical protein FF38_14136 [Lucilia cuprina]|uniref:DUF4776 domain-containing protein n=1 Tax=Lucilia cuprina TaxID=7375 RepID=A0A0L0C7G4_LUCCU|nr:hypothetical protein FF38_14136 [Lucilia cuprina]
MFTTNSPGGLGFIFDIIIVHINLTNIGTEEISKLRVDVKFIKDYIKITSSRINVAEFKAERGLEFKEKPTVLKEQLFKQPLECEVFYDGQSVGTCNFLWPASFLNCIAGDCGRELTHCDETDIKKNNEKVGHMEIFVRLQIKCNEFDLKETQEPKKHNLCKQTDNVINVNDVLFMVGNDRDASIACTDTDVIPASESGSSANATCLDLSNFRNINGKTLPNADILDNMHMMNCCRAKKSVNQCQEIIDSLMEKTKDSESCPTCSQNKTKDRIRKIPCKSLECISDSRFASGSSSDTYNPCQCISDEYVSESKSIICKTKDLNEKPTKRYCPLCHENVTWLPKFAACPKCGFKPIPYNIEEPYDDKLTADQILQEFTNNKTTDPTIDKPSEASLIGGAEKCRCTCKDGKICAHCRIKKLCEDIFKTPGNAEDDCGKCVSKSSGLYNICKTSSPDCRPYLTKVFQELKDLYHITKTKNENIIDDHKENVKRSVDKIQEAKHIKKIDEPSSRSKTNEANLEAERKKFMVKNFQQHESCKGKSFDYNKRRQYPGTKIGHKTCLNGFAGRKNVPHNMGWLWNAETNGLRRGWRPGAIRKPIKTLMQHFLINNNMQLCCDLPDNENCDKNKDEEKDYTKEPTLHICKKNGDFYITLRPLKNYESCNNMKPIQFKISKNPLLLKKRELKQYLKELGFAKCICHKPISGCCCRSFLERKKLEYQCCRECLKRQIPNCADTLILSDTTDSETEFDFGVTPPAGILQSKKCSKKRKKVSSATQYEENDWKIKEDQSKPLGKYFKLHNCAVGQRFGKAFGPYGSKGYRPGAVPSKGIYGPCGLIKEGGQHGFGKGVKGGALKGPEAFLGPDGKFSMALYLAAKAANKPTAEELAEKKRQKMALLRGALPPLLCKVDRRGKPIDICAPYIPITCNCEKGRTKGPVVTDANTVKNTADTKKNGRGFLFDIIVVRLDIPNMTISDTSKLLVDATFNGNNITITSSRINVLDFKAQRSFEFDANPMDLKSDLSKNPLRFKVMDGTMVIGYGSLEWPQKFLSGLDECAGEMTYTFETELQECDGTKTGTIQVILRLQPKCKEYVEDSSPEAKCRNANKEIDPNDILFVVGEENNTCCCSQVGIIPASDSEHELVPKCLDLSNFRSVNSQNVANTDILSSLDPACQKLKELTNHYQKLVDAVMTKDSYRMPLLCPSDNRDFTTKNIRQMAHKDPPPDLVENEPESLRRCPLCKENMTFLPKLAACPNCCYKPEPYFEEKPYNDTQTADQILNEFQDKLHNNEDPSSSDTNLNGQQKCRCSCKYGANKPCAHCRIRKLCEHIFQPASPMTNNDGEVEAKSSELYCASSDNRPFLTRIFSELKDIYELEDVRKKEFVPDERCERELNKEKKQSKLKNEKKEEVKNNNIEVEKEISKPQKCKKRKKRSLKPASELAVKSRLYDYQLVRPNFTTQIPHKTCINGFAGRKNVPSNMGWLWNTQKRGKWKPGAISKPIKELMRYFLKDFPADTLLVSQYSYRKTSKSKNTKVPSDNPQLVQKPTLYIHKKNGEYIITMRPLKPLEILKDSADPYENMKPIQFRIVKNPQLEAIRNLKKCLKEMGFKKCTCHRPIMYCYCRSFLEKKKLEYQCNKECSVRQLESCCDTLVLSDTSESEAEFDFGVTPPVGVIKPEKLKKVNLINVGTQYAELDWNPEPLFPKPPNKYMQMYQCAVGERKAPSDVGVGGKEGDKSATAGALRGGVCAKGGGGVLRAGGKAVRGTSFGGKTVAGKAMGNSAVGFKGAGDGLAVGKVANKGGPVGAATTGKSGIQGDTATAPKRKVDMLKYSMRAVRSISKADLAARRKERMNLLKGANPPLLCMVDRLGKPINPCDPCFPCGDNRIC